MPKLDNTLRNQSDIETSRTPNPDTLSNVSSYSISPEGLKGRVKSAILWGHWNNVISPLLYISRPKWVDKEDFKKVVESIKLDLPASGASKTPEEEK